MGRDDGDAAPDGGSSGNESGRGAQTGSVNSASGAADTHHSESDGRPDSGSDDAREPSTDEAIEKLLRPRGAADGDDTPEELADLKFIGPATAAELGDSEIGVESILDGAVCYRDLVDAGVNPGVAAKIRRWHSLSWSFSSGDDLDRRSAQVRGLGDEEREWVAASSGDWGTDDDAETADGDWTPTGESQATTGPTREGDWTPSGSAAQSENATKSGDWTPTNREESSDATRSTQGCDPNQRSGTSHGGDWTPSGTSNAGSSASADGSGDALAAEAAWRERSKPTPLTTLDGIDEADAEMLAEAGVRSVRRLATADPEHVADALQIDPAVVSAWKGQARESME
ncbi:helix-hairpin-helix domain-containing protein [Haloferax larsenii]|uniref:Helix-hairpin-helix domain-containing protein n=1 Tax=Haloferax larsenii TaxID=302484 RepID=A0ABY5RBE9_HALLR|nr:helix-hairpin-helix domain-containing protein [Haloferax larsenii]UVE49681.1 helix-hairpin-helix domain-containing protein [Haloferax larsenii]